MYSQQDKSNSNREPLLKVQSKDLELIMENAKETITLNTNMVLQSPTQATQHIRKTNFKAEANSFSLTYPSLSAN